MTVLVSVGQLSRDLTHLRMETCKYRMRSLASRNLLDPVTTQP